MGGGCRSGSGVRGFRSYLVGWVEGVRVDLGVGNVAREIGGLERVEVGVFCWEVRPILVGPVVSLAPKDLHRPESPAAAAVAAEVRIGRWTGSGRVTGQGGEVVGVAREISTMGRCSMRKPRESWEGLPTDRLDRWVDAAGRAKGVEVTC